jgi:uncharacterized protein YhdP
MQFKFDKKFVAAVAALVVAVLAVAGYSQYAPLVDKVQAVVETQIPAEVPAVVDAPDAG